MTDRTIVESRRIIGGHNKARIYEMGYCNVALHWHAGNDVLVDTVRKNACKLLRTRSQRKRKPRRTSGIAAWRVARTAKREKLAAGVATIARCVAGKVSNVRESAGAHPVFCWKRMARIAVLFFMRRGCMRKPVASLCRRARKVSGRKYGGQQTKQR